MAGSYSVENQEDPQASPLSVKANALAIALSRTRKLKSADLLARIGNRVLAFTSNEEMKLFSDYRDARSFGHKN